MNPPRVYTGSPSWTPLPPPSLYHPSGSSQCTSPKHPVSCIEPGLAIHFLYDIIHVSMPFSQIFPPSPSPTESIRLFYTSMSILLSCTQGYCYHLSKFHIYVLVYCIGVFGLENFEHYFASMWDECNCAVVWTFFGIAFLWDWNENWPFPDLWPLLSFPDLLAYWVPLTTNYLWLKNIASE